IAWNRPCEEIYNIKKGDAIGSNFFDVFPHLKTEEVVQLFNTVLKGEMIFQTANKSSLATGHFDLHMVPLWNEEQTEVTGIILILHDVTKEIELQQNLNDRLSLIENLVESSVDRIIAIDRNLNYLVWNKRCEEYYGLRKEKVIGRNVLEIFPDTQNTPTYEEFKKVLRGETIHIAARKDSGKEDYHEIYLIPVKNEKDNIIAILWILHDLSKEFEAENKLIEQTSLLQAVFDASLNGIILFKAVRNAEKEILDYEVVLNNQTTRVWNGRDLTGKRYGEEFPGIRQFGIFAGYNKVLETGKPMNLEVHYNEGGLDAWFRISAVKLNEDELVATAENITARKKTGEDAERYREVLQQTTSATPDAITIYDLENHQPVYLNNCLSEWLGYTTEELMKMGFTGRLQLIHADDRNALAAFNENLVAEKTDNVASVDYRVHAKNGSIVWLRNRSRIFRKNENQKVTHILSILQDITKEKNFNDQIDLQNKIFGYAEEIANMGTWTWNPDTNQVTYSDNMFNLFRLDRSVTPGFDTLPPFIHPDDRARILQIANNLKEGEDSKEAEYRVIRADGAERIFRNKTKLLRTEKNDRLFIGTTQDITDEITLRRKLEERTQYAESMIDSSINRMLVYDKDMNIIGWNRRSEEIMGVKKEQAIGKNVFELFPKVGEDPELKKAYEDALKGDYIYLPAKRSTYLNIYYERFFIPLKDAEGKTYAVLNTMHDVTDMVNRSKELLQLNNVLEQKNRELEQKNEEITHFAFVASHDLKEPLRKMRTFSDWILHHENLSETGSSFLNKLTGAVKRMDRLIEDILVLTKIHADDRRDEEVKLAVVLEDVIAEMKEDILSSQTTIESDSLPSIKGNSNQVFYLFKNLISNAIKFQNKGSIPNIKIDASVVRNESNAFNSKDDYLCVRFVDNGFGFDVKLSRKIFQVFQRLHSRNEFEGTGMGLAICKKIMENHNGFIKVKSEEGKGSEFACYFPLS
ncbi:MAG: PAS domain S-box protein, partial [Flavisolibacter sp.]